MFWQIHPLTYVPGKLAQEKNLAEKLATLIFTCGLKDLVVAQHCGQPFPVSYLFLEKIELTTFSLPYISI
jgi:hypothetical protein